MVTQIEPMSSGSVLGYQAVVDHLRREFMLGRLRPGDRLPAERQLAEHLGVARETLRQAYRVLEGGGHIEIRRGARGGAIIQDSFVDRAQMVASVAERSDEILQLVEFRSIVETAAAQLAAVRRSPEQLAELEAAHAELLEAELLPELRAADTRFHLAIAAASGNARLTSAIEDARVAMFQPVDALEFQFVKDASVEGHEALMSAIRARDPEAAAEAMRTHLGVTKGHFADLLAEWGVRPRTGETALPDAVHSSASLPDAAAR